MKDPGIRGLLAASFAGKAVYAVANLGMLPLFTWLLGGEAVGLLGFFTSLLVVVTVFEGGLSSSLIRELSRLDCREGPDRACMEAVFALVNTYLVLFAAIGLLVGLAMWGAADYLAAEWLKAADLPTGSIHAALAWMSVFIGLNFPILILQGAFVGRERHVALNRVFVPYALARTIGVIVLQYLLGRPYRVEDFFMYQCAVQLSYAAVLAYVLYRDDSARNVRIRPSLRVLRQGAGFGAGVFLISVTSVVVLQLDKLYLSGLVQLDAYAAYALASSLAAAPYVASSAIYAVVFPRFSAQLAAGAMDEAARAYRSSFVLAAVPLALVASIAWFLSAPLLRLLFENALAMRAASLLPMLLAGSTIQSLLAIPFALQLAAKWTSLALKLNLAFIPMIVIAVPIMHRHFDMEGVAAIWLSYNVCSFALTIFFLSRRFRQLRAAIFGALAAPGVAIACAVPIVWGFQRWIADGWHDAAIAVCALIIFCCLLAMFARTLRTSIASLA